MIDAIEKIFGLLAKPAIFLFRYFTEKPQISITLEGNGCSQSTSHVPGRIRLKWWRELVLHNDSAHLVRGIKVLRIFPKPWRVNREIPTRLEADQKVRIPIEAEIDEDHQTLIDRYGAHMQQKLAQAVFPQFVANTILEFELTNQLGRTVYQQSIFLEDGTVKSAISKKRRANGS